VFWRMRRKRKRAARPEGGTSALAQSGGYDSTQFGHAQHGNAQNGTAWRASAEDGQPSDGGAWEVDRRPQPPVAWSGQPGRYDARTDVYSISAAPPANGGTQMHSIYCPACGATNAENARFCSQCATPLARADRATAGETTSMIFSGVEPGDVEPTDQTVAEAAAVDTLPPNTALLVVRRGPNEGSRFLLDSELTEVGRRPDSDIFLDDVTVSRRHAEFYRQGGRFAVRDVGSLNGTYVNRDRIEEITLSGGDEVQIGKFRMVFLQGRLSHVEVEPRGMG
jgi:hypothetical protein